MPNGLLGALSGAVQRPLSWSDLIVVRNIGSLGREHPVPDVMETRGFQALLLRGDGRATHYVKFRAPSDGNAAREAMILVRLRDDPDTARLVPHAELIALGDVAALVLDLVEGESFTRRVARLPLATAIAEARACLTARDVLMSGAVGLGLHESAGTEFNPRASLEQSFRILEDRWLPPEVIAAVRAAMPGTMPSAPQHGDLTPSNVIWCRGNPVFLDFESFGLVTCPLFDAWHFVRNNREERGEAAEWLGVVTPHTESDHAWKSLLDLEASRQRLTEHQRAASLLWYLTYFSALIISRGVAERYCRPYLDDLARATLLIGPASTPPH